MKKFVAILVMAGLLMGVGLPASASAIGNWSDGVLYWSRNEVDSLFSPELVRKLNLSSSQRSSLDGLLKRNWSYRSNDRYSSQLEAIFRMGGLGSGSRVVIQRENNNLQTFLTILAFGTMISQARDDRGYYDQGIRIDDLLYLFYQILDMNQRYSFKIYFDRWYEDRFYRSTDYRVSDRCQWDTCRDLESRLLLSEKQRLEMDRSIRDLYSRQAELEKRYRDMEKEYLKKNWERSSSQNFDRHREELLRARKESLAPQIETRDRFRSVLNEQQKRTFDSLNNDIASRQPQHTSQASVGASNNSSPQVTNMNQVPVEVKQNQKPAVQQNRQSPATVKKNEGPSAGQNNPEPKQGPRKSDGSTIKKPDKN